MSLRLIPGQAVTSLLYRGLHDADTGVRLNAAKALQFRPFTPADTRAITALAAGEKVDNVRLALLENLKLEMPYYPQLTGVLRHAAEGDASSDIRRRVAGWLQ